MNQDRPTIHPGEILREEFLKPAGLDGSHLAAALRLPRERICGILAGEQSVCVDTGLRLAHFFGTSDRFWLELQLEYELQRARRDLHHIRQDILPFAAA
jgi:addiction module HigA family antidote